MAAHSDLGAVITYAVAPGNPVPTAYPASQAALAVGIQSPWPLQTGAAVNLVAWLKFTTGAASNFTGFGFKMQGSYNAVAGSWIDVVSVDNVSGGVAATEHVVTGLSVGTTYWYAFLTSNCRLTPGGMQFLLKGNGGAVVADDAAVIYVTAW